MLRKRNLSTSGPKEPDKKLAKSTKTAPTNKCIDNLSDAESEEYADKKELTED